MPNSADFTVEDLPSGQLLRLSGDFVIASIGALDRSLRDINGPVSEIDISAVTHMDTVGAWLVHRTAKEHDAPITGGANTTTASCSRRESWCLRNRSACAAVRREECRRTPHGISRAATPNILLGLKLFRSAVWFS